MGRFALRLAIVFGYRRAAFRGSGSPEGKCEDWACLQAASPSHRALGLRIVQDREWGSCAIGGGIVGAAVGGIVGGVLANNSAIRTAVMAGAIIGGIVGGRRSARCWAT